MAVPQKLKEILSAIRSKLRLLSNKAAEMLALIKSQLKMAVPQKRPIPATPAQPVAKEDPKPQQPVNSEK
ncbi:MAG: hypothetical protein E6Q97_17910 [Desulfurellales bacterium]|nr:MAG: hypothetical protein E6Q97_17910 [Desulfurellales bacterium]